MQIIEVLAEAGANLNRTIMGHLDRTVFLHETLAKIAEAGCWTSRGTPGRTPSCACVLNAARHEAVSRGLKHLACYELESPAVIETDAFKNR